MGGWRPEGLPDHVRAGDDIRVLHVDDQSDFLALKGFITDPIVSQERELADE